jgi:hypothetical protein
MYAIETLEIAGYKNEAVPNTFFRQDGETRHLAVLFPGYGYSAHMPLIYYPGRLLMSQGADVLRVEYAYNERADFKAATEVERDLWFQADVAASFTSALRQGSYQKVTLVGKSLGTLAMGHLLAREGPGPAPQCVWLTPLLRDARLIKRIVQTRPRSLFVVGTADVHYEAESLAEVQRATGGEGVIIDGADHSLEIPDDTLRSIRAIETVMVRFQAFVA